MPGRRNVRKLALRPPLPRRGIVWIPAFPADAPIEPFRRGHDPLHDSLAAHVWLVFPFATNLTAVQIAAHVRRVVANWPAMSATLRDVESILDEFVILMVRERSDSLVALHDKLYQGVLKPFLRPELAYTPHVTLGRISGHPSGTDFNDLIEDATRRVRGEWRCMLRELHVVTLHPDGKISIDKSVPLNFA
jgi:2'-5' RNA ligase